MAVGIALQNNDFDRHIPRNVAVPASSKWRRYITKGYREGNKAYITIPIYEGDSDRCNENHYVGQFDIEVKIDPDNQDKNIVIWTQIKVGNDNEIDLMAVESQSEPKGDAETRSIKIQNK